MNADAFSQRFFQENLLQHHGEQLFEDIPGFLFYIKNACHEFVAVNWALVEKFGVKSKEEILGKRDYDFVPAYLADSYARDDQRVLTEGKTIRHKVELLTSSNGLVDWYITNKVPLYSTDGSIRALAGVTRDFKRGTAGLPPDSEMFRVIEYIRGRVADRIAIADLARIIGLSVSAFERRFRRLFHMTPVHYIKTVRIHEACHLLNHSNLPISQVAQECGFCDQSYFTKEFLRIMNVTPHNYRRNHRRNGVATPELTARS